jgi:hypothetical protein
LRRKIQLRAQKDCRQDTGQPLHRRYSPAVAPPGSGDANDDFGSRVHPYPTAGVHLTQFYGSLRSRKGSRDGLKLS